MPLSSLCACAKAPVLLRGKSAPTLKVVCLGTAQESAVGGRRGGGGRGPWAQRAAQREPGHERQRLERLEHRGQRGRVVRAQAAPLRAAPARALRHAAGARQVRRPCMHKSQFSSPRALPVLQSGASFATCAIRSPAAWHACPTPPILSCEHAGCHSACRPARGLCMRLTT